MLDHRHRRFDNPSGTETLLRYHRFQRCVTHRWPPVASLEMNQPTSPADPLVERPLVHPKPFADFEVRFGQQRESQEQ